MAVNENRVDDFAGQDAHRSIPGGAAFGRQP